jgi:transposase
MPHSKLETAIRPSRRTRAALRALRLLVQRSFREGDLNTWRRAKAVLDYIRGKRVVDLADTLGVTRGSVNRWIGWYDDQGVDGLLPHKAPGPQPRLTEEQMSELGAVIDAGPQAAGFSTGVWTGPMIGQLVWQRFGVKYHNHHVPWLLHRLGFSVQRPRKRLARADAQAQEYWLRTKLPRIKKKPPPVAAS